MDEIQGASSKDGPEALSVELAESGAICEACGGVHIPTITTAILAISARKDGVHVPWCRCRDCKICEPFRAEVAKLTKTSRED